MKKCAIKIKYCNNRCPHFYHDFYDHENIYCSILEKKILDCEENCREFWNDHMPREFPEECPLEDC